MTPTWGSTPATKAQGRHLPTPPLLLPTPGCLPEAGLRCEKPPIPVPSGIPTGQEPWYLQHLHPHQLEAPPLKALDHIPNEPPLHPVWLHRNQGPLQGPGGSSFRRGGFGAAEASPFHVSRTWVPLPGPRCHLDFRVSASGRAALEGSSVVSTDRTV